MCSIKRCVLFFMLLLQLSFCAYSQQASLDSSAINKLKAILLKYEESITILKNRINELETQLASSEKISNSLTEELPALREMLENLESDYAKLLEYSEAYQKQLEESKISIENSLTSLNLSISALEFENKILKTSVYIVGAIAVVGTVSSLIILVRK